MIVLVTYIAVRVDENSRVQFFVQDGDSGFFIFAGQRRTLAAGWIGRE